MRDAGFSAEEGHQFTLHLTAELDNGKAGFYLRDTDDHGTWYLPGASTLPADYTQVGPSNRKVLVPISQADGSGGSETEWQSFDMGEGRGWDGSIGGAYVELDLGDGWSLTDRFALTSGNADTLGFVPNGSPVRLDSLTDLNGDPIASATTVSGSAVSGDTLVQQFGPWVVRKEIEAASNDLSIAKQWDSAKITAGYYASSWEVNEWWSIGNQKYYVLGHDGEQIASSGAAGEIECNAAGMATCGWNYDVEANGNAREDALYLAGEFYVGDFTFDLGCAPPTARPTTRWTTVLAMASSPATRRTRTAPPTPPRWTGPSPTIWAASSASTPASSLPTSTTTASSAAASAPAPTW
ncbi:hypothetical protein [Microbulbifer taiwanensis]|uniref:hypothetical protein n=1 Tax=Microbulbifer taiwanensis TaxID=986746 RepID=UPI003607F227